MGVPINDARFNRVSIAKIAYMPRVYNVVIDIVGFNGIPWIYSLHYLRSYRI